MDIKFQKEYYFEIGKNIVEKIQEGEKRANYGQQILQQVAADLHTKLGKGFSVQNLERMRKFYLVYSKSSNELRISDSDTKTIKILPLSWSHFLLLMRIENEYERNFYEIESLQNSWKLKNTELQTVFQKQCLNLEPKQWS